MGFLARRIGLLLGLWLVGAGFAWGMSQEEAERIYLLEVEKLMQGKTEIDYSALREAYALTRPYHPNRLAQLKAQADLFFRLEAWSEASRVGVEMVELSPVFAEGHMLLRAVYEAVDEPEEAAFHHRVAQGLIGSVVASGDGRTQRSAYVVVDESEMRLLARLHGWVERSRSQSIRQNQIWMTLDLIHPESRTVHFRLLRPLPPDVGDD